MDFEKIRRLTITAMFSDDLLYERIVLKGGNAMRIVYGISSRTSLDLDFSIENDFENVSEMEERMRAALARRFAPERMIPFDVKLTAKPSAIEAVKFPWWGGYELNFKVVDEVRYHRLSGNLEQLRREATVVGPDQLKTFTVDFSKCEYTKGKTRTELDSYTIYVYPPAMIALEKVRAVCQQMEDYAPVGRTRRPRPRDFYDIHAVVTKTGFRFDAPASRELLVAIFDAKQVPLTLLGRIESQREYHRADWPRVQKTTSGQIEEFDFYFDFVLEQIQPLHSLWMK